MVRMSRPVLSPRASQRRLTSRVGRAAVCARALGAIVMLALPAAAGWLAPERARADDLVAQTRPVDAWPAEPAPVESAPLDALDDDGAAPGAPAVEAPQASAPDEEVAAEPRREGFPDARERAARDWDAMTESVGAFWDDARRVAAPLLDQIDLTLVAVAVAAALGGYLGAGRRRPVLAEAGAQPRLSAGPARAPAVEGPIGAGRRLSSDEDDGRREPQLTDQRRPAPARLAAERAEPWDEWDHAEDLDALDHPDADHDPDWDADPRAAPRDPALRPTHGPLSEDLRARLDEADRLFAFFRERFGLDDESADDAIGFLTRLGSVVDNQRKDLDEARGQLERLRKGGAGATEDAAWDLVAEAGRAIRGAGQALRGDADFADFVREARLEEALRRLAALRAARLERGERLRPDIAEQEWPHDLFRAEALAAAYYPTFREWRDLRFGLTLASACLRHLLRREGVFVGYVRLLSPMAQGEGEVWSGSANGLRELAPVRRAVQAAAASGADGFVVDCETFGYFDAERDLPVRSRLIVYDQAEWR